MSTNNAKTSSVKTSTVKKDTQKLQRTVVDALENVKAQDIVVFDTEHLSALFERVIIASGTSNRQTKALASSVRESLRKEGYAAPRVEGETNGEWIIVDCGAVVTHIMQPNFRQYYHLEELWGEKPIRMKLGAAKPMVKAESETQKPPVGGKKPMETLRRSSAAKKGQAETFPSRAAVKKAADRQAAVKKAGAPKAGLKKALPKKGIAKLVVGKKPPARKTLAGKFSTAAPAKKAAPRKAAPKRSA